MSVAVSAAAPVGQTIWIRASATGDYVSADQNRGSFAPLVADRAAANSWEQFQVVDAGGGYIALKSVGTGLYVSADLNRGAFAPLVADRPSADTWEHFIWTDLTGSAFTLRGRVTGHYVSADLNRGDFAPLVSDRVAASTWETFTWGAVGGTTPPPNGGPPPGFPNLIWSDEFNGPTIDASNWTYDIGNSGWGNNELENYTNRPENARIENGMLVIEARRENLGGSMYTSARLKTQGLRSFGVNTWVEARIQVPQGQGIWPAFWELGNSISTVGWPSCGEIDIMEMRGQNPTQNFGTMHWANDDGSHASYGGSITSPSSLAAGFHTFAISRTTTAIKWYLDGVQYFEGNIAGGINSTSELQAPFFILLNVAVGGNFVGSPDGSTSFPQQLRVDYVRVWGQ
ncbi:MAG: glycoside hydrolase family 16 protein [Blastocatellia bacterium]|nr:glycoside hydrolase family 16 protein [Blastocatellia bacterium]